MTRLIIEAKDVGEDEPRWWFEMLDDAEAFLVDVAGYTGPIRMLTKRPRWANLAIVDRPPAAPQHPMAGEGVTPTVDFAAARKWAERWLDPLTDTGSNARPEINAARVILACTSDEPPFAWCVIDSCGVRDWFDSDHGGPMEERARADAARYGGTARAVYLGPPVDAGVVGLDLATLRDDALDIGAGTWRVDERPICGCDSGADPCGDEDHDLEVADRVIADTPGGGLVPMDDIRHHEDFARAAVRIVNAAPVLLAEIDRLCAPMVRNEILTQQREEARAAVLEARAEAERLRLDLGSARGDYQRLSAAVDEDAKDLRAKDARIATLEADGPTIARRDREHARASLRERDRISALFSALVNAVEDLGYRASFETRPPGAVMPGMVATLALASPAPETAT